MRAVVAALNESDTSTLPAPRADRLSAEEENGFPAIWFAATISPEVNVDEVIRRNLLEGRVATYCGVDGAATVHNGSRRYAGADTTCPSIAGASCEELPYRVHDEPFDYPLDPYVPMSNSTDLQHLTLTHELQPEQPVVSFDRDMPSIGYRAHHVNNDFGDRDEYVKIAGANISIMAGRMGGTEFHALAVATPTAHKDTGGQEEVANASAARERSAIFPSEGNQPWLSRIYLWEDAVVSGPDKTLMKYLRDVRGFLCDSYRTEFCR